MGKPTRPSPADSEAAGNLTKRSNIAALERATERSWPEWLEIFDAAGAARLSHPEIAHVALNAMPGSLQNPEWWAQGAAIAFEQHAGLRVAGQSSTGDFRVGASRTMPITRDEAMRRWAHQFADASNHLGHGVSNVRQSRTEKRTFWRATLDGAGKLEIAAESKGDERSLVTVQQTGLDKADHIEQWRAHWKACLAAL